MLPVTIKISTKKYSDHISFLDYSKQFFFYFTLYIVLFFYLIFVNNNYMTFDVQ